HSAAQPGVESLLVEGLTGALGAKQLAEVGRLGQTAGLSREKAVLATLHDVLLERWQAARQFRRRREGPASRLQTQTHRDHAYDGPLAGLGVFPRLRYAGLPGVAGCGAAVDS